MAKKSWHKKHISTKWGVVIILTMLLGIAIAIPQLDKNQDPRSKAAVDPGPGAGAKNCKTDSGFTGYCFDKKTTQCPYGGYYKNGSKGDYCQKETGKDMQCCLTYYGKCSGITGSCYDKTKHPCTGGHYEPGERGHPTCPRTPNDVQCCVRESAQPPTSQVAWPFRRKFTWQPDTNKNKRDQFRRIDQGWDLQYSGSKKGYHESPDIGTIHIVAVASGVVHKQNNPKKCPTCNGGGFGPYYPYIDLDKPVTLRRLINGKYSYRRYTHIYYAHTIILPGLDGKHVTAGQEIAYTTANGCKKPGDTKWCGDGAAYWLEIGFGDMYPDETCPAKNCVPGDDHFLSWTYVGDDMCSWLWSGGKTDGGHCPSDVKNIGY